MRIKPIFCTGAAMLLLLSNSLWAAENVVPYTNFAAGNPARADSVNANFSALESATPVMWASIDQEPLGYTLTGVSAPIEVNSVNIDVPPPGGVLLIMGSAFVMNLAPLPIEYILNPLVGGIPPDGHSFLADFQRSPATSGPFKFTLSYTYTVAITTGTHVISQELGPLPGLGPANFVYNKNNLNVLFFPSLPGGAPISTPAQPAGADTTSSENGP